MKLLFFSSKRYKGQIGLDYLRTRVYHQFARYKSQLESFWNS